jgi:anti-sigma regulatory factor (Ser/Thr protein kinase)
VIAPGFSRRYACALDTPSVARHELERWLPDSLEESDRGALRLLVSELVTNSIRHGGDAEESVALNASIDGATIRVEVRDRGAGFAVATPVPRGSTSGLGGYGLFLVERMASRWGVDTDDGTRVWFELDLTPRAS